MKKKSTAITIFLISLLAVAGYGKEKPNFLFILADDMSFETIGAYGLVDIDTPHLDTLVKNGATFSHAYNMGAWNGAVCIASRAMLNTGRFVWHAGELDANKGKGMEPWAKEGRFWSQQMEKAGYRTYMTGKWHVKIDPKKVFEEVEHVRPGMAKQTPAGYDRPKSPEDYAKGWKPWEKKYGGQWEGGEHWCAVGGDDAVSFLKEASTNDQPFFMYVAFNAAHDPRQSPKSYVDRYPLSRIKVPENFLSDYPYAKEMGCGPGLRDEQLMPFPRTKYATKVNRQEYYALITYMDDQVGRVLEALKKSGKADNTYIVFTADNGLAVGHHGLEGKQNQYEESVRMPFMIVGPGIKAGDWFDTPIYMQDIMPTIMELAGIPKPDYVEFHSLVPILRGEKKTDYNAVYGAYTKKQRMIAKGGWKLIRYPSNGVELLYNLKADPHEMNNLADNPEYAEKRKELSAALDTLSKQLDDPMVE